jgi:uridine phosphorylase
MQRIPESELIVNKRGAIYHLDVRPEELGSIIITVGDPSRVSAVSKYLDSVEYRCTHREFITHTGYLGKKKITVLSTGIGTDNIDIVLQELDALVNIDLESRTIKPTLTQLNIIRIGTSGSLQRDVAIDHFVASSHGLGIDNLLNFYRHDQNEEEKQLLQSFITQTQLHNNIAFPYISGASPSLLKHFVNGFQHGITVTCPGFYGPQGRVLRLGLSNPMFVDKLTHFNFGQHRITNFEMETAGIYGLGRLLGHHCISLSAIVANRVTREFSRDVHKTIDLLIRNTLETITEIN